MEKKYAERHTMKFVRCQCEGNCEVSEICSNVQVHQKMLFMMHL